MRAAGEERLIGWPGAPVYRAKQPRVRGSDVVVLLVITLLGATLRFTSLSQPALWHDESATLWRTIGTFDQMTEILRTDGFLPLHYELYYFLRSHFLMTPFMMRLVPAVCGTLTIPAVYFLARQLASRRVAVLAALFTATSAFMLNYSRDAKMYAELWLAATLNFGCFLWWCRARSNRIAWWAWVATGALMTGLHALAFVALGIQAVWYVTQKGVHWAASLAFVLGVVVISAGPVGYVTYHNQWDARTRERSLDWIEEYNSGRDGLALAVNLGSAFLFKFEFPAGQVLGERSPGAIRVAACAMTVAALVAVIGALPWRARKQERSPITLQPAESPPHPWWRLMLWLGVGLLLPVYGFYCASVPDFMTPVGWLHGLAGAVDSRWPWVIMLLTAAVVGAASMPGREFAATLAVALVGVLAITAGVALERGGWTEPAAGLRAWYELLMGPYPLLPAGWTEARGYGPVSFSPLLTMLGATLGLLWYYCAPAGFVRWRSVWAYFGAVVICDLLIAWVVVLATLGSVVWVNYQGYATTRPVAVEPVRWAMDLVTHPGVVALAAVVPLFAAGFRGSGETRLRGERWLKFAGVLVGLFLICEGVAVGIGHRMSHSVWMPRYLGVVWPLACIGLMILLDRLPTRGLRGVAMVLLVGFNLLSYGARVFGGTEPPVDKMAHDVATGAAEPEKWLTYVSVAARGFHPGAGAPTNFVGSYYFAIESWKRDGRIEMTPWDYRAGGPQSLFTISRDPSPGAVRADLAAHPGVREIVVWTDEEPGQPAPSEDALLKTLGDGWAVVDERVYPVHIHWTWESFAQYRRKKYERVAVPQGAAAQATQPGGR